MVGLCDFPPAVFPLFGYRLVPVASPVAVAIAVSVSITVSVTAVPIASAVVAVAIPAAVSPAVIAVVVAIPAAPTPAAPAASTIPAARAHRLKFAPIFLRLAAVVAVATDVTVEFSLLGADAIATVRRLGSCAGQQDSAQQHRRAQGRRS